MYSKDLALNSEYSLLISDKAYLEKVIKDIADCDKEALQKLYYVTSSAIYAYVLSILKNKHEAEDVFQDVYIKVYENAALYQSKGKPLAWILTIAKNECLMKLRKRKDNVDIDLLKDFFPDTKSKNFNEDRIILNAAFKHISDEERNILILHVLGGLKHREIAKMLGLSLSTVLSKYNRTLKKLREILKEDIV